MSCTCTEAATKNREFQHNHQITCKGRLGYNPEGEQICTVDSFGFRSRFEGECDDCWKAHVDGYNKAMDYD